MKQILLVLIVFTLVACSESTNREKIAVDQSEWSASEFKNPKDESKNQAVMSNSMFLRAKDMVFLVKKKVN
tara:strand:+ start:418 stop:630 length:213 start_codon:yes stop_codon:yes gene_type:complete